MASVAVPLIAEFAPMVIDLIAGLVHKSAPAAEQKYGAATGPVKFADVFGGVMMKLQDAAAAGQIPKALPPDETIKMIVQTVISSMKLSGSLGAGAITPAASQAITLKAGQSLTITLG